MPRREEGRFGARVKCPHCHGNGCPHDPQRLQRGQRASNQAHGPAVAWATSVTALAKSYVHRKEKAEEGGDIGGAASLHSKQKWTDQNHVVRC